MADVTETPPPGQWPSFFQTQVLPLEEEMAFREYLDKRRVPHTASIQDLNAHYDQFCQAWEPGGAGR